MQTVNVYFLKCRWFNGYFLTEKEARDAARSRGWKEKEYSLTARAVQSLSVNGEPDRADLNYYHADCSCGYSVMFSPGEDKKPCHECGAVLSLLNRQHFSEDECLISEAGLFN
jgi:hypothetical protein